MRELTATKTTTKKNTHRHKQTNKTPPGWDGSPGGSTKPAQPNAQIAPEKMHREGHTTTSGVFLPTMQTEVQSWTGRNKWRTLLQNDQTMLVFVKKCGAQEWQVLRNGSRLEETRETWQLNAMCDSRSGECTEDISGLQATFKHKWYIR